jgi:flagella basal body P-ring formation protein FlgA
LGDVADVNGENAATLAALELFPAPPAGEQRFLRVRELQDLLLLRGIPVAEHQISGASQVTITSGGQPVKTAPAQAVSLSIARRANRRVCEAVARYLDECASDTSPTIPVFEKQPGPGAGRQRPRTGEAAGQSRWSVQVELTEAQARTAADPSRPISISGGRAPWTGVQRFQVTVQTPQGPVSFPLDARTSLPSAVVVACRSLARGTVVRPEDVELRREAAGESVSAVHSIEEVVGRETTRSVAEGKVLTPESVRAPLLVRKGEVVTVFALSGGIRLRTFARARDEGGQDDLVAVESMLDRSTYFARVTGAREVEVYARSPRVEQKPTR